jgi:hypothetical protein
MKGRVNESTEDTTKCGLFRYDSEQTSSTFQMFIATKTARSTPTYHVCLFHKKAGFQEMRNILKKKNITFTTGPTSTKNDTQKESKSPRNQQPPVKRKLHLTSSSCSPTKSYLKPKQRTKSPQQHSPRSTSNNGTQNNKPTFHIQIPYTNDNTPKFLAILEDLGEPSKKQTTPRKRQKANKDQVAMTDNEYICYQIKSLSELTKDATTQTPKPTPYKKAREFLAHLRQEVNLSAYNKLAFRFLFENTVPRYIKGLRKLVNPPKPKATQHAYQELQQKEAPDAATQKRENARTAQLFFKVSNLLDKTQNKKSPFRGVLTAETYKSFIEKRDALNLVYHKESSQVWSQNLRSDTNKPSTKTTELTIALRFSG